MQTAWRSVFIFDKVVMRCLRIISQPWRSYAGESPLRNLNSIWDEFMLDIGHWHRAKTICQSLWSRCANLYRILIFKEISGVIRKCLDHRYFSCWRFCSSMKSYVMPVESLVLNSWIIAIIGIIYYYDNN